MPHVPVPKQEPPDIEASTKSEPPAILTRSRAWWLLFMLYAGLGTTLYGFLWPEAPFIVPDAPGYLETARDLSDGKLDELHDRPPGYPVLLAALGAGQEAPRQLFLVQTALHFFAAFGLAYLLWQLLGSRPVAAAFATLAALPPSVAPAAYVRSETLAEFVLGAGFVSGLLWLRRGSSAWLWLSAALLAYAALVQPAYLGLGIVLAATLGLAMFAIPALRRRSRRVMLPLLGLSLVVVGGFSLSNQLRHGYFGVTPLFGFNLSTRTVRVIERMGDEHATVRELLIEHRDRALVERHGRHHGMMYIWDAIDDLTRVTGLEKGALSQFMLRRNLELIARAPLTYLEQVGFALASFWMPGTEAIADFGSPVLQLAWSLLFLALNFLFFAQFVLLLGLAICFTWPALSYRRGRPEAHLEWPAPEAHLAWAVGFAIMIVLYTAVVSTLVEIGNPRYRVPVNLLLWFAIPVGWRLCRRLASRLQPASY